MRPRRLPALLLGIVTITASATVAGTPAAQALPAKTLAGRPSATSSTSITLITGTG